MVLLLRITWGYPSSGNDMFSLARINQVKLILFIEHSPIFRVYFEKIFFPGIYPKYPLTPPFHFAYSIAYRLYQ